MPRVSVVIPAWNLWDMTRACLESLAAHTPPNLLEVCVADNGSEDATAGQLEPLGKALFGDRFRRVRFEENRGFAMGSNAAALAASGDYVLFLNNDTLALPGWLPPLLEPFISGGEQGRVGAVGPLLLYEGGERVQHYGVAFTYGGVQHLYAHFPANHPAVAKPRRFQAMTAAALLMPRQLFMDVGMFHEGYRNGFEDLDLCFSLARVGYTLQSAPQSRMIHRESQTPGRKQHDPANAALFAERWKDPVKRDLYAFAGEDGLDVCLSDTLETCVCLPPRKEAELNRMAAPMTDSADVWELLRAWPVWRGGYARMSALLDEARRFDDALYVRVLESQLFPGPQAAEALERAAGNAGSVELAAQAGSERLRQAEIMNNIAAMQRKASLLARQARRDGAMDVEALYLRWLHKHGG